MKMSHITSNGCCLFLVVLLILATLSQANNVLKTSTFMSPKFELEPGSVENKIYFNIDFPKGHIAVKRFDAEVVDEAGNSIPLHETYMHHWVVAKYFIRKGVENPKYHYLGLGFHQSDFILVKNSGVCGNAIGQYFGLGSETRKTDTRIPDPYGIEVGNVGEVPEGYEERWLLNVHAIDTRGAVDKFGCTECRCGLYNVTVDEYGKAIEKDYIGGLRCCADGTRCRVKQGFENGERRGLYLKYNVTYVEWDDSSSSIVPVKIYIFDVTDTWGEMDSTTKVSSQVHNCKIEYDVPLCLSNVDKEKCIHTQSAVSSLPNGGDVIYAVSHQHTGGVGSTLYGEDGRTLCSSYPIYGEGKEAGNEEGYIVGMTTCYPQPGSVKIAKGEKLTIVSNYSSSRFHTGVMGLFYILVAEQNSHSALHESGERVGPVNVIWAFVGFCGVVGLVAAIAATIKTSSKREDGYEPMVA